MHLPLPREAAASGKMTVVMASVAGPNAVISELWLLRRKQPAVKRVLILTGDDYPAHLWRETGPEFAAILRADPRLEVTISESPALLGSPALSSYDAVFLHFKNYAERLPTAEPLWKNLESYVNGGGGLVIAHFGCGALQEWNGFVNVAGRIWDPEKRGHDPYGEFIVRILQTGHPATMGLKDFTTTDELYTCLTGDTEIDILAEATSKVDQSVQPMAFVLTPGKGRVFNSPLGHNLGALKAQGVRDLYLKATQWAAGL
jgi:type 1 glutamine amidotransferase